METEPVRLRHTYLKLADWCSPGELTQAALDLRAATKVIDDRGWVKGVISDETGAMCAMGALVKVEDTQAGPPSNPNPFYSRHTIAGGVFYRVFGVNLIAFNDEADTWPEVKAKMLEAADIADAVASM